MARNENVKDIVAKLEELRKNNLVYVKTRGYSFPVKEISVDEDGDVVLLIEDQQFNFVN